MSNESQEPVISLSLDDDDIAGYREQTANRPRLKDIDAAPGGASKTLVLLLLVLVLLSGAASFAMYRAMTEAQRANAAALATEQSRIAALERAMSATGENISEQETEVKSVLKDLDHEVRKLWDNVWKAAKIRLDEHDTKIAALEKDAKGTDAKAEAAKKDIAAERLAREKLQASVTALETAFSDIDKINQSLKAQGESIKNANTKIAALGKKIDGAAGESGNMSGEMTALTARVSENEEWIKSNNAFRRQVIKDIRLLKKLVAELRRGDAEPEATP